MSTLVKDTFRFDVNGMLYRPDEPGEKFQFQVGEIFRVVEAPENAKKMNLDPEDQLELLGNNMLKILKTEQRCATCDVAGTIVEKVTPTSSSAR